MWRLTASVSESCLNALVLHVTIADDDSHRVSESQAIPADESVECAGTFHCPPSVFQLLGSFVLNANTAKW
jgi:hypothetical protein